MGFFSKKSDEKSMLPDLPNDSSFLPSLPEYNLNNEYLGGDLESGENFELENNFDDKMGLKGNESYDEPKIPALKNMQKSNFEPLPNYNINQNSTRKIIAEPLNLYDNDRPLNKFNFVEPRTFEMSSSNSSNFRENKLSSTKSLQPVYVRLDSFKLSLDGFEEIKSKIGEVEDLLSKIKEVKKREEKELIEWEREIQVVKARIEKINNDIFKNVE